jgi:hypothetical protein
MKITNSLLFVAFVLGSGTLLPAQDHLSVASPTSFNAGGAALLARIDTTGGMRAGEVFALLSDNAGYSDPSANEADPPAESSDSPSPCGNSPSTNADPSVAIDNYEALVRQGISATDARQIAQITGKTGI